MASGNLLASFSPHSNQPPASNHATLDSRNSTLCLDFDAGTDEAAVFAGYLPGNYSGGGLTVVIIWAATSATTGDVVWTAAIERNADGGTDIDADSFATAQTATATAPGTSGVFKYTSIAFTSGAQMDSLAANEAFRLKITRDADNGSDTMTGDAEVFQVAVKET